MDKKELKEALEPYGNPNWIADAVDKVEKLKQESLLSDRQAEVYALRKARLHNDQIADVLGLKTDQVVSKYYGNAKDRFEAAERTVELRDEIEPAPKPNQEIDDG
jgi:DNA-binding CsgD family transcriptional regulator